MKIKSVFQNRNLTLLWSGQVISQSGDSIYHIGLIWLVLEMSGSEMITGLVAMSSYLPAVLLSLHAGLVADRYSKRHIMLWADLFRSIAVLAIPVLYFTGNISPAWLIVVAFSIAMSAAFFNPARDAIIPDIVPADGLLRANSLIQTSWQFALLLGPAIAGGLLHYVGNIHLFTIDSLVYLLAFACILLIIIPKAKLVQPKKELMGMEIREGLNFVLRHKVLLPLLLITIADNLFIMGPAIVGTPVIVKRELGLGAESYALIQGCYAVGMLIGTALLVAYGRKVNKGKILLIGMMLDGLTFVPVFWVKSIQVLAIIIIIHSLAIPMLTVSRASMIQELVPVHLRGRIFALVNMSVLGMSAISAGISGIILEQTGVRELYLWIGCGGALCGVIGWLFAKSLKAVR